MTLFTANGINISSYKPGSSATLVFNAKVNATASQLVCGPNTLVNRERTTVNGGYIEDTANTVVTKSCEPGKIDVCDLSTKKVVRINESDFDSKKYTKDLSVCTPPELPHTGASENIVAFAGLGALIASVVYYVRSRRLGANL